MKRYFVIKNCPNYYYEAIWEHPHRCNLTDGDWSCDVANTPDDEYGFKCPMKQIVNECKETDKYYSFCLQKNRETNYKFQDEENMTWLMGRSHHANEILRLLEIEEVDEN